MGFGYSLAVKTCERDRARVDDGGTRERRLTTTTMAMTTMTTTTTATMTTRGTVRRAAVNGRLTRGPSSTKMVKSVTVDKRKRFAWTKATTEEEESAATTTTTSTTSISDADLERNLSKFAKKTATTFAPRSSTAKKNPAYKGSVLYTVFEVQAYLAIVVGGLLAYNVIWPSDEPSIARLMGMWSVWMFTVPSLRARDCAAKEKDALNLLFVAIPLVNVLIPFVWKSFAGVFTADVLLMAAVYAQKGVFAADDAPETAEVEQK